MIRYDRIITLLPKFAYFVLYERDWKRSDYIDYCLVPPSPDIS